MDFFTQIRALSGAGHFSRAVARAGRRPCRLPRGLAVLIWLPLAVSAAAGEPPSQPVQFNRDIRPILSQNCYQCHGPDAGHREADLRLDLDDSAIEAGVIVPGKPDESPLLDRIFAEDPDEAMPPREANKTLSAQQKELLRRWIAEGAVYQGHWAYLAPVKPTVPA
ncbi:MAG: c-type cytochrome domain-containing protein, partial [Thermoguttaceae bacterium]